jgi:tRNA A-37 threonylcarbamoyl transferase component Bud32/tetratricopeptide (TPR) repeat protein
MTGEMLHHYRVLEPLGSGGMGEVFAAEDTRLKRRVAIKFLPAAVANDPERRGRFEREAQAVAALNHPGIVTIYSVEQSGSMLFLTMELVEGQTLDHLITTRGLPPSRLLQLAIQLADAVATAHQRGIIHRDLKPGNVMIASDWRVKVLDFGLAKLKEAGPQLGVTMAATEQRTAEGRILGTVAYMAPEQAEGQAVDQRADIFSLGVLFFELATGERPFKGDTGLSVLSSILKDTPPSITEIRADLPPELARIIKHCLAKDPSRRYQSALDLRNDLDELKQNMDSAAALSRAATLTMLRHAASPRTRYVAIASLVALGLGGAGYIALRPGQIKPVQMPAQGALAATTVASNRVAVAVFENRTGDPSLESLGSLLADRLIEGVTKTGVAKVTSTPTTPKSVEAGTLINGAYYLRGNSLEFQARILETPSRRLLHALEPVSAPRSSAESAFEVLRQQVMGAVAAHLGDAVEDLTFLSHVPTYDAYREFAAGLEFFFSDVTRAQRYFERALVLDAEFFDPRFYEAVAYWNVGNEPLAVLTAAPLVEHRDRLTPFERCKLDWFISDIEGRRTEALAALIEAQKINPQSGIVNYLLGLEHLRLNHPKATLGMFVKLRDAESGTLRGVAGLGGSQGAGRSLNLAAVARHILGDFEEELRLAHEAERIVPQSINYRGVEARAMVGLGRVTEALRVVEESLALPGSAGGMMVGVALELRAHGDHQRSIDLANRTVEWYRSRPPDVAATASSRAAFGTALYTAERWSDAQDVFRALVQQFPDDVDYRGHLGTLAARRGDRADATKYSEWLRQLSRPYLVGSHTFWRARITAVLGDEAAAVDLLRDAFAQGAAFNIDVHQDMDLERLKGNSAFRALVRPKE